MQSDRQPVPAMSPQERADWFAAHQVELERYATLTRRYLNRRAARGTYTPTDASTEQFLGYARDLIQGLAELREAEGTAKLAPGEGA